MDGQNKTLNKILEAAGFNEKNSEIVHADLIRLAKSMVLDRLLSDLKDADKTKVKAALRGKEQSEQTSHLVKALQGYYKPEVVKSHLTMAFENLVEEYVENVMHKVGEPKKKKILAIIESEKTLAKLRDSMDI
jgi:hypothetical protein